MPTRPNVIYILTDQQRWDFLGCNGNDLIETPNIDRLAATGVCFDRFYANHGICTPSRAALMTGRYPSANRVYDNGCPLPESEITLPQVLAVNGYDTVAFGKLHLTPWRDPEGRYFESRKYWQEYKDNDDPEPYYGFRAAEICTGHVDGDVGHYGRWLEKHYPEAVRGIKEDRRPHPSGADGAYLLDIPPEAHANAWLTGRACEYLTKRAEGQSGGGNGGGAGDRGPFFMFVGFPDPHHPYQAPEPWGSMYSADDVEPPNPSMDSLAGRPPEYMDFMKGKMNAHLLGGAPDFNAEDLTQQTEAQMRQIVATSMGMVSFIDHQVGRILDALDATGEADNTIVVFSTDHGDYMGDHHMQRKGPFLLEGLVRIPMVMKAPGVASGGTRTSALASHIDFMPTLLELLDIEPPRGVQGKSFAPVLRGESNRHRDRVMIEFLHQFQLDRNVKALVTDRWKLCYWGGQTYGELYDLQNDPLENENLWDDPDYAEVKADMMRQLLDELVTTENVLPWPPAVS